MKKSMKAWKLEASWAPRPSYRFDDKEFDEKKAVNANSVWKEPELRMVTVPIPQIQDDEILIKIKRCGVCGSDTHCFEKDEEGYVLFSGLLKTPVIPGHEFSGVVVQAGNNVSTFKVGDAVAAESIQWCGSCSTCRSGRLNQCEQLEMVGFSVPGAFAEYIAIKEKYCWNLDALRDIYSNDEQLFETGALLEPIGCAFNGIFIAGQGLTPGDVVVIYGAGPIGLGALILARQAEASKIFMFDLREERNQLAFSFGADFAENPDDLENRGISPAEFVLKNTNGYGADIQIEAAGAASRTVPEMNQCLCPGGKVVFLGRGDSIAPVDFNPLVSQAGMIIGCRGQAGYDIYPNVIRMIAAGKIKPHGMITSRFPFDQVRDALETSSTRQDGKIMVCFP